MGYQVRLTPDAENDLRHIHKHIADNGAPGVARAYVNRILGYVSGFDTFPKRGTMRDDLRPGLRVVGFERRVSIAFVVEPEEVVILRILYAGQQFEGVRSHDD